MIKLIGVFWILTCVFGNKFLKFNVIKGINIFYILMGICILYSLRIINKRVYRKGSKEWCIYKNTFIFFCMYTIFYIIFSFFNFTRFFDINNLGYDKSFIIRQGYFVFASAIGIVIFDSINRTEFIENIREKYIISIFAIVMFFRIIGIIDMIPFKTFIIAISSYIYFNVKKKLGIVIIILAIVLAGFDQSTYVITYIILFISLIEFKPIIKILGRYLTIILGYVSLVLFSVIYFFYDKIVLILYKDPNAIWRWQYWVNEFKILVKSKFVGVGFGTAYADNNIFLEIYNPNAFVLPLDSQYSMEQVLFITSQHNSLLNIFYRLGVVGGISFIMINVIPLIWYYRYYFMFEYKQLKLIKWAAVNFIINFIVIVLNPGMESPRFFLSYIIMFSIFVGLLYKNTRTFKEGANRDGK